MDSLYFLETYIPEHHADLRQEAAEAHLIAVAKQTTGEHADSTHPGASQRMSMRKAMRIVRDWLRKPREVANAASVP